MKYPLKTKVNGQTYETAVSPQTTLAEFLRDELGLIGVKQGCGQGECGACTVLLDGKPVPSCLILAVETAEKEVVTIEGVSKGTELHPLQKSFIEHGAIQCGFCTSGMILTAKSLIESNPEPDEQTIRAALAGNLCRCTGYQKIVEAVSNVVTDNGDEK